MSDHSSYLKVFDKRLAFWSLLAGVYLIIRFAFTQWLDSLGAYASYGFEVAEVSIAGFLAGHTFLKYLKITKQILICSVGSLIAGFAIFRFASLTGIQIPFDLKGTEPLLFLLVVAPILEELIFRFFLWQPIEWLGGKPVIAWVATSLMFSYSHLHAIWFVPKEIHTFIAYQTIYTFILGVACGFFVFRNKSVAGAILIHFAFNLGFYLGSLA